MWFLMLLADIHRGYWELVNVKRWRTRGQAHPWSEDGTGTRAHRCRTAPGAPPCLWIVLWRHHNPSYQYPIHPNWKSLLNIYHFVLFSVILPGLQAAVEAIDSAFWNRQYTFCYQYSFLLFLTNSLPDQFYFSFLPGFLISHMFVRKDLGLKVVRGFQQGHK